MLTPMIYAVIESMGHAYERAAIEQALQVRPGKSPITGLYYGEEGSAQTSRSRYCVTDR
jgi:hypothetical protein